MTLHAHPQQLQILMCDFDRGGFRPPEMVKMRPVVVVSPKRYNATTCLVVPLSSVEPVPMLPFHHRMDDASMPRGLQGKPTWAKANMVAHVALDRLDRPHYRSSADGRRRWEIAFCSAADWEAIRRCLRAAMGL